MALHVDRRREHSIRRRREKSVLCVTSEDSTGRTRAGASRGGTPARAAERWALIPAVGAKGKRAPLQTFEELLLNIGHDGSRAHNLVVPCSMPYGHDTSG
jgi:hypothetical protein